MQATNPRPGEYLNVLLAIADGMSVFAADCDFWGAKIVIVNDAGGSRLGLAQLYEDHPTRELRANIQIDSTQLAVPGFLNALVRTTPFINYTTSASASNGRVIHQVDAIYLYNNPNFDPRIQSLGFQINQPTTKILPPGATLSIDGIIVKSIDEITYTEFPTITVGAGAPPLPPKYTGTLESVTADEPFFVRDCYVCNKTFSGSGILCQRCQR